jgi:hypothetical protein
MMKDVEGSRDIERVMSQLHPITFTKENRNDMSTAQLPEALCTI